MAAAYAGDLVRVVVRRQAIHPPEKVDPDLDPEAVRAARQVTSGRMAEIDYERAGKLNNLLAEDPHGADRYISKLLSSKVTGLPDIIQDPQIPGALIADGAVMEAAANVIRQRGEDREVRLGYDPSYYRDVERKLQAQTDKSRNEWRRHWLGDHQPYSAENLDDVLRFLNVRRCNSGVPYAAVTEAGPEHRGLLLAIQNMCRFCRVLPRPWSEQPTYHALKPGKPAQVIRSFRTLSSEELELRLAECLWALHHEEALWQLAGPCQFGRSDPRLAVLADVETSMIRDRLGLPLGVLHEDQVDAFTTTWTPYFLTRPEVRRLLGVEGLAMAQALLSEVVYVVVKEGMRAKPVCVRHTLPEGRRLSPAFFVAQAAAHAERQHHEPAGVGVDPPEEAVAAYQMVADGTLEVRPDKDACARLLASNTLESVDDWMETLLQAPSDADRLMIIDMCSTTRVGLVQYVDDNKYFTSSLGAIDLAMEQAEGTCQLIRAEMGFGRAKTCFRMSGGWGSKSRSCSQGVIEHVRSHEGMGIPMDTDLRFLSLLRQIESRGVVCWQGFLTASVMLHLPVATTLRCIEQRLEPKACYGAEFLILRGDWKMRLDRMQVRWLRSLIDLDKPVPTVHLLEEAGQPLRLSAKVIISVANLLAKVALLPRDHLCARLARVAAEGESWTSVAKAVLGEVGIPPIEEWLDSHQPCDPASAVKIRKKYMREIVRPAVLAEEAAWRDEAHKKYPRRLTSSLGQIAADAAHLFTLQAMRAWSQLRLQDYFSRVEATPCPLCKMRGPATAVHPLSECEVAADLLHGAGCLRAMVPARRLEALLKPADEATALEAVAAASEIRQRCNV